MVVRELAGRIARSIESRLIDQTSRSLSKNRLYGALRSNGLKILYLFIMFVLAAGIVSNLLESQGIPAGAIIAPTPSQQTVNETIINFFTLVLGTGAIYLMYQTGRQTMKPRIASFYLLLGMVLLLASASMGLSLVQLKG